MWYILWYAPHTEEYVARVHNAVHNVIHIRVVCSRWDYVGDVLVEFFIRLHAVTGGGVKRYAMMYYLCAGSDGTVVVISSFA